jgi:hypothetical protein
MVENKDAETNGGEGLTTQFLELDRKVVFSQLAPSHGVVDAL